jgi:hypothetical protein
VSLAPTLLWPLDSGSKAVAESLAKLVEARQLGDGPIRVIAHPEKAEEELRACLIGLREEREDRHACDEIRIVYLANAQQESALAGLARVGQIADALPRLVPGAAQMEIVVLLPLMESPDEPKDAAVRFLREVERMAGQTRNLDAVFVYEDSVTGGDLGEDIFGAGLGELLCRTLFASGVADASRRAGRAATAHQRVASAGKCCFTTVGGRTLVFEAEVTQERLAARLARGVASEALAPGKLTAMQLAELVQQSDEVIDGVARSFESALTAGSAPAPETKSDAEPEAILSLWRQRVDGEVENATDRLGLAVPEPGAAIEQAVHAALAHPLHFTAAELLLRLLTGETVTLVDEPNPDRVFGMLRMHETFVEGPWLAGMASWLKAAFERFGGGGLPARLETETLSNWLGRAFAGMAGLADGSDTGRAMVLKWLLDSALAVAEEPSLARDPSQVSDPTAFLAEPYTAVARRALAAWRDALAERERAETEREAVEREFSGLVGWLFRRREHEARKAEVEQRIDAADAEAKRWQTLLESIHQTLGDFAKKVALPLRTRLACEAKLCGPIVAKLDSLRGFIKDLKGGGDTRAETTDAKASASRGIRQVLGEASILDRLHAKIVNSRTSEELLGQAMEMPAVGAARSTWGRFDCLAAHLPAGRVGAEALIGRLFDFGTRVFEEVRGMGVLDALATLGPAHTDSVLEQCVKRALTFFPFASGRIARLSLVGAWQPHFIVRCRLGDRAPVARTLSALTSGACEFLAIESSAEFDFTCVIAGFPAGVIPWYPESPP